jgi:hypothetical protein
MVCTLFLRNSRLKFALLSPRSLSSLARHRSCCHIFTGTLSLGSVKLSLGSGTLSLGRLKLSLGSVKLSLGSVKLSLGSLKLSLGNV